jgi:SAM-dependent methyltransferase
MGEYVLGVDGLALLRQWLIGNPAASEARLDELVRHAATLGRLPLAESFAVPEVEVAAAYERWAETYDGTPNSLIVLEERAVRPLLAETPPGSALDAACGTGHYAAYLRRLGHEVIGIDASPAMLNEARGKVPDAQFRLGELAALPLEAASVDLAVCALALTHCADLGPATPGARARGAPRWTGRALRSAPARRGVWGQALFRDAEGHLAWVRNRLHWHSAYISAAIAAGLAVRQCLELPLGADDIGLVGAGAVPPAGPAAREAFLGLPGVLVRDLRRG